MPRQRRHVAAGQMVKDFPGAEPIPSDELLTTPCTVLVPAALERVITDGSQQMPPLAPPNGRFMIPHFHDIHIASAATSPRSTLGW